MKALRIAAGVGAAAGILAIAGCPLAGIGFPGTQPTPFPGFASDCKLTGRFSFDGKNPPQTLTAEYKTPGGSRATETATTDSGGYFCFKGTTAGKYQILFDDKGEEIKDPKVNTVNVYVADPVTAPATDLKTPQVTLDLKWEPAMKPEPSGTFAGTFSFSPIPNLDADYEIAIFDSNKSAVNTVKATTGSATWDKKKTNGDTVAAGTYYYQIKFFKKGGTFGGENFYGQMKYIKFTI